MRARYSLALALSLGFALACSGAADHATSVATARGPEAALTGGNKTVTVMSRNLYLGAELGPVIGAQTLPDFLQATTAVWAMVQKNDFDVRAIALADEIARARPALIGLQEAYVWRTQTPSDPTTPATTVRYDYVNQLLGALAARGLEYRLAAEQQLIDFEAPTLGGLDVRTTDHSAILAREDVKTSDAKGGVYQTLLPISLLGQPFSVPRGWTSVVVQYRGETFRFVTTHLEAYYAPVRTAQAAELAAVLATETLPVILVADLNSHPGTEGEAVMAQAGFVDGWAALYPDLPGLTSSWPEDLTKTEPPFYERIDYVMTRGPVVPRSMEIVGQDPAERVGGLWPSDHGGLVAKLRLLGEKQAGKEE